VLVAKVHDQEEPIQATQRPIEEASFLAIRILGIHILLLGTPVQRLRLVKMVCRVSRLLQAVAEPSSLLADTPFELPSLLAVVHKGYSRLGIPADGQPFPSA